MESSTNRRRLIAGAVIEILADGGSRGLSHQAVDSRLGLARGSTSYYFRTREALITAAANELMSRSRLRFDRLTAHLPDALVAEPAAELIAEYAQDLCTSRSAEVRARLALMPEVSDHTRQLLLKAFFSLDAAQGLCSAVDHQDPEHAAETLLDLLEGMTFRAAFSRSQPSLQALQQKILGVISPAGTPG